MKTRNQSITGVALVGLALAVGMTSIAQAATIQYVGNQDDVEAPTDTPTTGWRNPTPTKPLDIDGDNILGTDGYHLLNPGVVSLPSYIASVTRLAPNSNSASSFGVMDDPTDPSGTDDVNFGIWHTSNSTPSDIFTFVITGSDLADKTLRIGLLYDGYNGAGSQFLRVTQTDGGGSDSIDSPTLTFANTGLDVMFFDLTNVADGDTFVVYADAVSGISHVAGITFDTLLGSAAASFPLTITPAGSGYDLAWTSQADMLYNVRSSTDLSGAIATWMLVEGDIQASGAGTNTKNVTPAEPRLFYAVEEYPAPPVILLSEDFEADNGGFTTFNKSTGTDWAWGAPTSPDQGGGAVLSGNGGSAKCWGTDIGDPGGYIAGTDTVLRSPVIDLTDVADATLSFAQALDIEAPHTLVVNVIEAATDTVLQGAVHTSTPDTDTGKADWKTADGIAIGGGQPVRIEWRFTGEGSGLYLGAYIDDVVVTVP